MKKKSKTLMEVFKEEIKWKPGRNRYGGNIILDGDGFYISYNPCCHDVHSPETALVKNEDFYILDGDHRKKYEKVINKGFDKCLQVYKRNIKYKSLQ